jgi:hypothetical protein
MDNSTHLALDTADATEPIKWYPDTPALKSSDGGFLECENLLKNGPLTINIAGTRSLNDMIETDRSKIGLLW